MTRRRPRCAFLATFAALACVAGSAHGDTPPVDPAPPSPPPAHIESTRADTVIERRANRTEGLSITLPVPAYLIQSQWEPVCVTPCEVRLDPNSAYRVGNGAPSGNFYIPRTPGPLRLHVNAGSPLGYYSGVTLVVLGVLTAISGAVILGSASAQPDASMAHGFRVFGWSTAGLGVVLAGVGLPLWLSNMTRVTTEDGHAL